MKKLLIGLFALALAITGPTNSFADHISYDPYADAVQSSSAIGVINPQNAVGPPDGNTTGVAGINRFIVLDMGDGEEGTGTLRVHFGSILVQGNIQVIFLDDDLIEITRASRQLAISSESSTQDFGFLYKDKNKAYRYVRLASLAEAGFALDAIEALDYVGKTDSTDTDGDGIADRTEQHAGTSPENASSTTPPATTEPSQTPSGPSESATEQSAKSPTTQTKKPAAPTEQATAQAQQKNKFSQRIKDVGNALRAWWQKWCSLISLALLPFALFGIYHLFLAYRRRARNR